MDFGLLNKGSEGRKNGFVGFPEQEILEENCLGEEGDHFSAMTGGNFRGDPALGRQRISCIAAVSARPLRHPSAGSQQAESHPQISPVAMSPIYDLIEFHEFRQNTKLNEDPAVE